VKFSSYPETFICKQANWLHRFDIDMRRFKALFRISVKNNETGETHKIELGRFPFPARKYMLRFDGKVSANVPEASFSQVCARLRKLLRHMAGQKSCTKNR